MEKRSWAASYTSARGLLWMYGLVALSAVVGGIAAATGQLERWAELSQQFGGWVFVLVLVPLVVLVMGSMFPRDATIELEGSVLRIVRGRHVVQLDRDRLRISTKRWAVAPGHDFGGVLVLDDGTQRITIGARDRRIGQPDGECRSPKLWIEGTVLDDLLPSLGVRLDVLRPDEALPREEASVELIRNSNRGATIALLMGGMFGGMFLVIGLGIAVSRFYPDAAETLLVFMVPAIYGPMIAMFTYHRRGKVRLQVDERELIVTRRGKTTRVPKESLVLTRGMVNGHAQHYGRYQTPALSIALPGGETLDIGTSDVRLKWTPDAAKVRTPRYLVGSIDFRLLVGALGLSSSIRLG